MHTASVMGKEGLLCDGNDLFGCLAETEDYFGHAVPQGTVMIDFGKAEILKGKMPEAVKRAIDIDGTVLYLFKKRAKIFLVHF